MVARACSSVAPGDVVRCASLCLRSASSTSAMFARGLFGIALVGALRQLDPQPRAFLAERLELLLQRVEPAHRFGEVDDGFAALVAVTKTPNSICPIWIAACAAETMRADAADDAGEAAEDRRQARRRTSVAPNPPFNCPRRPADLVRQPTMVVAELPEQFAAQDAAEVRDRDAELVEFLRDRRAVSPGRSKNALAFAALAFNASPAMCPHVSRLFALSSTRLPQSVHCRVTSAGSVALITSAAWRCATTNAWMP